MTTRIPLESPFCRAQAPEAPAALSSSALSPCSSAPAFGVRVVKNGRDVLEDAFTAQVDLACVSPAVALETGHDSLQRSCTTSCAFGECDSLSFFGVYDGHGGHEAAQHCADRLHKNFRGELHELSCSSDSGGSRDSCSTSNLSTDSWASDSAVITPRASPSRGSEIRESSSTKRSPAHWSHGTLGDRHAQHVRNALRQAYIRTDMELAGTEIGDLVGSTAVTAVVGKSEVFIAHCGDSRAVLCRKGRAVALTADHKPNRKDEADRVAASGGKVLFKGGSHRVMGLLAMSRAIGDHFLRPFVIPEPEVMSFHRSQEDELLILASDGLWDVFTAQEAVQLALRSNTRACDKGASRSAACRISASVLTRAAIERGSRDNITVLVIDLQRPDATTMTAILAAQCSDEVCRSSSRRKASEGHDGVGAPGVRLLHGGRKGLLSTLLSAPVHRRSYSTVTTSGPVVPHGAVAGAAASVRQQEQESEQGQPPSFAAQRVRSQSFSSYELGSCGQLTEVCFTNEGPGEGEVLQLPLRAVTTGFVAQ